MEQYFCLMAELRSESEKKSEIESLKLEISSLKEHIVGQQQDLQAKTAQVGNALKVQYHSYSHCYSVFREFGVMLDFFDSSKKQAKNVLVVW